MSTEHKVFVGIVVAMVVLVVVAALCPFPGVNVSVQRRLVGPRDEAMTLLLRDASLEEIQVAFERSGKKVDDTSFLGGTLLYHSVAKRRPNVARWLLEQGANPNGTYADFGGVPLEKAIRQEDIAMVRLLIQVGADPDLRMCDGWTSPRGEAEKLGNSTILAELPPNEPANGGTSPPVDTAPSADSGIGGSP